MLNPASQLALDGGPAMIPAGPPDWPPDDPAVREALLAAYADGDWGRYHGRRCRQLIEALCAMHGAAHAMLCCTGTMAVELALRGVQVEAGDEVILAGYDFPGNFRAIETIGALPVLVDIDPRTWSLDAERLAEAAGDRTKAVIVSHLHGGLAAMEAIMAFASERGIRVVEDSCQSPGARIGSRTAGTWGDVGVLSFGGSKLLTAGRGGALLTRDPAVLQRMRVFSGRGNDAFAMSELQAAVLLPQLARLAERNAVRARSVEHLLKRLAAGPAADSLQPVMRAAGTEPSYYKLAWRLEKGAGDELDRESFIAAVQAEGVAIDAGFRGFSLRSVRRCRTVGSLQYSARAAADTLLLHHPVLLDEPATIELVAAAIQKVAVALEDNRRPCAG